MGGGGWSKNLRNFLEINLNYPTLLKIFLGIKKKKIIFFCQPIKVDTIKNFINILNYIKKAHFKLF